MLSVFSDLVMHTHTHILIEYETIMWNIKVLCVCCACVMINYMVRVSLFLIVFIAPLWKYENHCSWFTDGIHGNRSIPNKEISKDSSKRQNFISEGILGNLKLVFHFSPEKKELKPEPKHCEHTHTFFSSRTRTVWKCAGTKKNIVVRDYSIGLLGFDFVRYYYCGVRCTVHGIDIQVKVRGNDCDWIVVHLTLL